MHPSLLIFWEVVLSNARESMNRVKKVFFLWGKYHIRHLTIKTVIINVCLENEFFFPKFGPRKICPSPQIRRQVSATACNGYNERRDWDSSERTTTHCLTRVLIIPMAFENLEFINNCGITFIYLTRGTSLLAQYIRRHSRSWHPISAALDSSMDFRFMSPDSYHHLRSYLPRVKIIIAKYNIDKFCNNENTKNNKKIKLIRVNK